MLFLRLIECGIQFRRSTNFTWCALRDADTVGSFFPLTAWQIGLPTKLVVINRHKQRYHDVGYVINTTCKVSHAFPFDACTPRPFERKSCVYRDSVAHAAVQIRDQQHMCHLNRTSLPVCLHACWYPSLQHAFSVQHSFYTLLHSQYSDGQELNRCVYSITRTNQVHVRWTVRDVLATFWRGSYRARAQAEHAATLIGVQSLSLDKLIVASTLFDSKS